MQGETGQWWSTGKNRNTNYVFGLRIGNDRSFPSDTGPARPVPIVFPEGTTCGHTRAVSAGDAASTWDTSRVTVGHLDLI